MGRAYDREKNAIVRTPPLYPSASSNTPDNRAAYELGSGVGAVLGLLIYYPVPRKMLIGSLIGLIGVFLTMVAIAHWNKLVFDPADVYQRELLNRLDLRLFGGDDLLFFIPWGSVAIFIVPRLPAPLNGILGWVVATVAIICATESLDWLSDGKVYPLQITEAALPAAVWGFCMGLLAAITQRLWPRGFPHSRAM